MLEPSSSVLDSLKTRYGEPQRHYHTWDHIQALIRHFETIEDQLNNATAVRWAIYWHDAIYDPQAADNEDKSADLLRQQAESVLNPETLRLSDRIIRATKRHELPDNMTAADTNDLALFLDMDLSILAAEGAAFDTYEAHIRAEYAFVPIDLYRQARAGILKGFLNRERLYFSDHFFDRWEQKARANLQRSIHTLEQEE